MNYTLKYPTATKLGMQFYFAGDPKDNSKFYSDAKAAVTCADRLIIAKEKGNLIDIFRGEYMSEKQMRSFSVTENGYTTTVGVAQYDSPNPRWFYITLSNCAVSNIDLTRENFKPPTVGTVDGGALDVEYTLHLTNGGSEFSYDEEGMLAYSASFLSIETIVMIACAFLYSKLKKLHKLHYTVRMFIASVICQWCSSLSMVIGCDHHKNTGQSRYGYTVVSRLFEVG